MAVHFYTGRRVVVGIIETSSLSTSDIFFSTISILQQKKKTNYTKPNQKTPPKEIIVFIILWEQCEETTSDDIKSTGFPWQYYQLLMTLQSGRDPLHLIPQ